MTDALYRWAKENDLAYYEHLCELDHRIADHLMGLDHIQLMRHAVLTDIQRAWGLRTNATATLLSEFR